MTKKQEKAKLPEDSPCISKCNLVEGFCTGCGRGLSDISNWTRLTKEQKIRVNQKAKDRLKK